MAIVVMVEIQSLSHHHHPTPSRLGTTLALKVTDS